MKYRKLRIAWSLFWGIACLLLIALWVRSYRWHDEVGWLFAGNQRLAQLQSHPGRLIVSLSSADGDTYAADYYARIFNTNRTTEPRVLSFSAVVSRFSIHRHGAQSGWIELPFWFLVVVSASIGSVPWIKWQFSLRTLLILTTLVAVGLGFIVWASRN